MKTYESTQKQLLRNQNEVYNTLSNLTNLNHYIKSIPEEHLKKIENLQVSSETISFNISPIGNVTLRIVNKEEPKMIKFGAENFPIQFNFWIQLVGVAENDTRMKLTLKVDIPIMLRPMIGNKLDNGIEQIAEAIRMALNNPL